MESSSAPDLTKKKTVPIVPKSPRGRVGKRSAFLPSVNLLVDKFEEIQTPNVSLSPTKLESEAARQDTSTMDTSDGKLATPQQNGSAQIEATHEEASHGPIVKDAKIKHKKSGRKRPKSHSVVEGPVTLEKGTARIGRPLSLERQTPSSSPHLPRDDDHPKSLSKNSSKSHESRKEGGHSSSKLPSVRHLVKRFERHSSPKDSEHHHRLRTHGSPMHQKVFMMETNGDERSEIQPEKNGSAAEPRPLISPLRSPERLLLSEGVRTKETPTSQEKRRRFSHKELSFSKEQRDASENQHTEEGQKTPVTPFFKSSISMPDLELACDISDSPNLPQPEPITIIVSHSYPQANTKVETQKEAAKVQDPAERARKTSDTLLPPQPKEEFENEILSHLNNNSEKPAHISTSETKSPFELKQRPTPTLHSDELEYFGISSPSNGNKVSSPSSSLPSTPRRRTDEIIASSPLSPTSKSPIHLSSTPKTPESALPRLGAESMRVRSLNPDELKLFGLDASSELEDTPKEKLVPKTEKVLIKQEYGVRLLHGDELKYFGKEYNDKSSNHLEGDLNKDSNLSGAIQANELDEQTHSSVETQVTSLDENITDRHQVTLEKDESQYLNNLVQKPGQSLEKVLSGEPVQNIIENKIGNDVDNEVGREVEVQVNEVSRKTSIVLETLVEVSPATEKLESEINESIVGQFTDKKEVEVIGEEEASLIKQLQDNTPALEPSTLSDLEDKNLQEQALVGGEETEEDTQSPPRKQQSLADKLLEEITQTLSSLDSSPLQSEIKLALGGVRQGANVQKAPVTSTSPPEEAKTTEITPRSDDVLARNCHVEENEDTPIAESPEISNAPLHDTTTEINSNEDNIPDSIMPPEAPTTPEKNAQDQKPSTAESANSRAEARHGVSLVSSVALPERGVPEGSTGEGQHDLSSLSTIVFTSGAAAVIADAYLYLAVTVAHHILLWLISCIV